MRRVRRCESRWNSPWKVRTKFYTPQSRTEPAHPDDVDCADRQLRDGDRQPVAQEPAESDALAVTRGDSDGYDVGRSADRSRIAAQRAAEHHGDEDGNHGGRPGRELA